MKKVILSLLAFVFVTAFSSCGGIETVESPNSVTTDQLCPTGVVFTEVPVFKQSSTSDFGGAIAYIVRPNDGCSLPTKFCIFQKIGYGGGLSCTVIEE